MAGGGLSRDFQTLECGDPYPAAASAMALLAEVGVAREITGKRRNRIFVYERYLAILNEGTEVR